MSAGSLSIAQRMRGAVARAYGALWEVDEQALSRSARWLLTVGRLLFITTAAFFRERLQTRATALAFVTVLSLVPSAALTFSIAKWAGLYDVLINETLRPFIDESMGASHGASLPTGVVAIRDNLERFLTVVANTDVFHLGVYGFLVLLLAILRVLRGAEEAFDAIWAFPFRRPWFSALPRFLLVASLSPVALGGATILTAARQQNQLMSAIRTVLPLPLVVDAVALLFPPLLACVGMFFAYLLLPSAHVRIRSAWVGAIVGGLAWYAVGVLHIRFQIGIARYNAIYSGFGSFPIFLVWMHLSWVAVLLGAQAAAAHQNAPTFRQLARARLSDHASRQALALRAMVYLVQRGRGERLRTLAKELGVGVEDLRACLDAMVAHALLTRYGRPNDPVYSPPPGAEAVRVKAILEALEKDPAATASPTWEAEDQPLSDVLDRLSDAMQSSHHNRTIGELKQAAEEARRGQSSEDTP